MNLQSEEVEVAPAVPASQSKLGLGMVAILATLLGILLTVVIAGAWLHYQRRAAWAAEVLALENTLKEKNVALDEMRAQNATLAKHLKLLKGYSIASSTAASEMASKAEGAATAPAEPKVAAKSPVSSKPKKTKAQPQDCELVGKTPEQQAATLQRCVSQIDPPSAKPRQ